MKLGTLLIGEELELPRLIGALQGPSSETQVFTAKADSDAAYRVLRYALGDTGSETSEQSACRLVRDCMGGVPVRDREYDWPLVVFYGITPGFFTPQNRAGAAGLRQRGMKVAYHCFGQPTDAMLLHELTNNSRIFVSAPSLFLWNELMDLQSPETCDGDLYESLFELSHAGSIIELDKLTDGFRVTVHNEVSALDGVEL